MQHIFRCSINETVNHFNFVLLIASSTNNGKISYSGEFYSVATTTLDMTISKETGQLLLNTNLNIKNLYQPQLFPAKFNQVTLNTVLIEK